MSQYLFHDCVVRPNPPNRDSSMMFIGFWSITGSNFLAKNIFCFEANLWSRLLIFSLRMTWGEHPHQSIPLRIRNIFQNIRKLFRNLHKIFDKKEFYKYFESIFRKRMIMALITCHRSTPPCFSPYSSWCIENCYLSSSDKTWACVAWTCVK